MGHEQTFQCRAREVSESFAAADRFESLLNALPAAVVVLDGNGRIQECNPAARELLEVPLDGERWRDIARRVFRYSESGEDLVLRNGRWVSLSTCPLGTAPGQILLLHDTTENRRLHERLEHARRLTDMGRMAASLAHQIRTPLTTALLYASHLKRDDLIAEKRRTFAGKLADRLRHLERLVTDMLVFARGGGNPTQAIEVESLIDAVVEAAADSCAARGTALIWEKGQEKTSVTGNRTLLLTLFQNLIANALDAMEGGGRIDLAVRRVAEQVEITVIDEGPGIAPELQERIFEPFTTTRSGGNGLGLAVVRAVARAHQGDVRVDSKPGPGSRFTVSLPLAVTGSHR